MTENVFDFRENPLELELQKILNVSFMKKLESFHLESRHMAFRPSEEMKKSGYRLEGNNVEDEFYHFSGNEFRARVRRKVYYTNRNLVISRDF